MANPFILLALSFKSPLATFICDFVFSLDYMMRFLLDSLAFCPVFGLQCLSLELVVSGFLYQGSQLFHKYIFFTLLAIPTFVLK